MGQMQRGNVGSLVNTADAKRSFTSRVLTRRPIKVIYKSPGVIRVVGHLAATIPAHILLAGGLQTDE